MSSILECPPAPSVTAAVEVLQGALGAVSSLVNAGGLEQLPASELLEVAARLQRIASQAGAVAVAAVSVVAGGEAARCDGFASTPRFLEVRAGLSKSQSRARVALGGRLSEEFPATGAAWVAGQISEGMVQIITTVIPRKLKNLPAEDYAVQRGRLEAMALHAARTKTVGEVRRAIERAAIAADPVGAAEAAVVAKRNEFLSFTPTVDGVEVRGFLAWDSAGVVLPCFEAVHDSLYRDGRLSEDYASDIEGLAELAPSLRGRRREHRNALILADLATRLLDGGDLGTKHSARPHVTVTVHADDFIDGLGGDLLLPGFGPVPVPNETIERFLCDAEIHPVLTRRPAPAPSVETTTRSTPGSTPEAAGGALHTGELRLFPGSVAASADGPWRPPWRLLDNGFREDLYPYETRPTHVELDADTDLAAITEFANDLDDHDSWWNRFLGETPRHVLDVGRSRRTAPPKIRRALAIRDGGCAVPGCDVDASRCEAHHITYWEHHGETSISNMVLLCSKHHHMVHEGRWRILRNAKLDPGDPHYITLVSPAHRT